MGDRCQSSQTDGQEEGDSQTLYQGKPFMIQPIVLVSLRAVRPTLFFRSLNEGWKGAIEPAVAAPKVVRV